MLKKLKLNGSMVTYKTFENLPPHKNVHVNVIAAYSESPKKKKKTLQPTKMAFNRWIDNKLLYPQNWILFSNLKNWTIKTQEDMNKS